MHKFCFNFTFVLLLEQPACNIFEKSRERVSLSCGYPEAIAILLHKEEVISDEVLKKVETHKDRIGTNILLNEMYEVVYKNYKNLKKFADILQKFTATKLVGKSISEEYGNVN